MTKLTLEVPTYQLGDILFSPTSGVIKKNNVLYKLRAKECSLLNTLVDQFPEILSRNDIVEKLYSNTYATDATINQLVKRLRQSLDDDKRSLIRTIPKQGYQLAIAPIKLKIETSPIPTNIQKETTNQTQSNIVNNTLDQTPLNADSKLGIQNKNERNLERFCGAVAVIGVFLSAMGGYYYAEYSQQHSTEYLELIDINEYTPNMSIGHVPIALSENNQLKSVMINENDNILECQYDNNLKSTLCSLN